MRFFAKRLAELMGELTNYALAEMSGVSRQTIGQLLKDESQPSWETVQRLAKAMNLDFDDFADPNLEVPEYVPKKPGRPKKHGNK